jgi:PAS domain S-box-containing protein
MRLTRQHRTHPARPPANAAPWWRWPAAAPIVLAYLVAYLAAARWEHLLTQTVGLAPWSPRAGLSLALLLLLGLRFTPVALAAELAAGLLLVPGSRPGWLLLDAAVTALAWAATAAVLTGRLRIDLSLRAPRDLGRLLLIGVAAAPLAVALARAGVTAASGSLPRDLGGTVAAWWAGNAVGVVLVVPLLLALVARCRPSGTAAGQAAVHHGLTLPAALDEAAWRPRRGRVETAAQVAAIAALPLTGLFLPAALRPPLLAACFAPMVWAAVRRGLADAAAAAAATGLALAGALALHPASPAAEVADLQAFLLVAAGATLWVGVLADARAAGIERGRQLLAVLDAAPDTVATVDRAGRLLYLNQAGRQLLGLGRGEPVVGRLLSDLLPQLAARLATQIGLGPEQWTGATTLTSDGRRIPLGHVAVAHQGPGGRVEAVSAFSRDLSETRRLEAELAASAERLDEQRMHLATITTHMPVALLVAGVDGTCVRAEGLALASLGTKAAVLEGASLFQALEGHDQLVGDFCQAAAGNAVSSWATVGDTVLETHFRPVVGRNGKVKQVIGLLGDVTEQVRAEASAADLQARLDALQAGRDALADAGTVRTLTAWLRHLEIMEEELAEGRPVTALGPVKHTLERVLEAGGDPSGPQAEDAEVVLDGTSVEIVVDDAEVVEVAEHDTPTAEEAVADDAPVAVDDPEAVVIEAGQPS